MRLFDFRQVVASIVGVLIAVATASAQSAPSAAPAFIRVDGTLAHATGEARTGDVQMIVSLYAGEGDTTPLWSEVQVVTLGAGGQYAVLAGASQPDGLPRDYFGANGAQWVGLAVQGEPELPRVRILAVPYALNAANAETLGGLSIKDFVISDNLAASVKEALSSPSASGGSDPTIMGTSGRIAKFDATGLPANVVDSTIFESGSNVGVGTTSPLGRFQVRTGTGRNIAMYDSSSSATIEAFNDSGSANTDLRFQATAFGFNVGNVGIGTSNPTVGGGYNPKIALLAPYPALAIESSLAAKKWGIGIDSNGGLDIFESTSNSYTNRMYVTNSGNVGIGTNTPLAKLQIRTAVGKNLVFYDAAGTQTIETLNDTGSANTNLRYQASQYEFAVGNVGIGTSSPTSKLHVAGAAYVSGNVTVDGNIGAKYQDVAEWVESGEPIEAGTVVIVAEGDRVVTSQTAYDTRVAGAISRQPGLVLGEPADSKSLVAQSGRVRIKVDASYGAIKAGDLLVTSPTAGHAMVSKPMKVGKERMHRPGTLVGKALESLATGKGEILVLLTLQ